MLKCHLPSFDSPYRRQRQSIFIYMIKTKILIQFQLLIVMSYRMSFATSAALSLSHVCFKNNHIINAVEFEVCALSYRRSQMKSENKCNLNTFMIVLQICESTAANL